MPITFDPSRLHQQQHIVLRDISWQSYENLLGEMAGVSLRITFDRGSMEIMSPLREHEAAKKAIACLLELFALERGIEIVPLGSTTFRRRDRAGGLEPDESYYVQSAAEQQVAAGADLQNHPPDLAIEIDITSRSIQPEPVYATLEIPELWRFDGKQLRVFLLEVETGTYLPTKTSSAFPQLPIEEFNVFVQRLLNESRNKVLREFQTWTRGL